MPVVSFGDIYSHTAPKVESIWSERVRLQSSHGSPLRILPERLDCISCAAGALASAEADGPFLQSTSELRALGVLGSLRYVFKTASAWQQGFSFGRKLLGCS